MPLNWIDTSKLSFNSLLLLERVQISWFPGWVPEEDLALALQANPVVAWYLGKKCPEIRPWLDKICMLKAKVDPKAVEDQQAVCAAEQKVMQAINDLLVYVIDPRIYDAQPFLGWDSAELTQLVDFIGKVVLDIGSGTGRLALVAAEKAKTVFPVEPVGNLRRYIKEKAKQQGFENVFPVDGLITEIPFPEGFAEVTMSGHVFGDLPEDEIKELERVTKTGGMVILCPGTSIQETRAHKVLVNYGYSWSKFEEPKDGWKRKYWKTIVKP